MYKNFDFKKICDIIKIKKKERKINMFKAKKISTNEIVQVLDTYLDEYANTYFLIWENENWRWRPASNFVPPNYQKKI